MLLARCAYQACSNATRNDGKPATHRRDRPRASYYRRFQNQKLANRRTLLACARCGSFLGSRSGVLPFLRCCNAGMNPEVLMNKLSLLVHLMSKFSRCIVLSRRGPLASWRVDKAQSRSTVRPAAWCNSMFRCLGFTNTFLSARKRNSFHRTGVAWR